MKKEKETLKTENQKEMDILKDSCQNHFTALQKLKINFKELQEKENLKKEELLDQKDENYDLKKQIKVL